MSVESIKVAVRCRPFTKREIDRKAKCIIQMNGPTTIITDPNNPSDQKKFNFDYSYWSHDGFKITSNGIYEPVEKKYASQQKVFDDLGNGMVSNAFQGYNCSLFAYGQTGSGKSYSIVGFGRNKGVVPMTCDELFKEISNNRDSNKRFEVTLSILEIYNENVRDLLTTTTTKNSFLQVREHPAEGFYVANLKKVPVASYSEIENWMNKGTSNRTIAATNMNETSSRAHTVVSIRFGQIIKSEGGDKKMTSILNLVDLAGSERVESTGATGDRLKEGAKINQSLSNLGNVISALVELAANKKKNVMVPYRNSVLTKLLKNALGGNSKTVMMAALSPADINYSETLSTLRYADRVKQIKTCAMVNEDDTNKIIKLLQTENDRLRKLLAEGKLPLGDVRGLSPEEIQKLRKEIEEEIRAQLLANQEEISLCDQSEFNRRLKEAQMESMSVQTMDQSNNRIIKVPHLLNLNEDPILAGVIVHPLNKERISVGQPSSQAKTKPDVALSGLNINPSHATIEVKKNVVVLKIDTPGSKVLINGCQLKDNQTLKHKDRILFGSNHLYVFNNPLDTKSSPDLPDTIDWEFAQQEIAKSNGFQLDLQSKEHKILSDQLIEILPMVSEANGISDELDKKKSFDIVLISDITTDMKKCHQLPKVFVEVQDLVSNNVWLWDRSKFIDRRYMMQDLYQRYSNGDDVSTISKNDDPFWDPPEVFLVGAANMFLQSLCHCLDFNDNVNIVNYKGTDEGVAHLEVAPCHANGKLLSDDDFVDDPKDLLNKPYYFKVTVASIEVYNARFNKGLYVEYIVRDNRPVISPTMKGTLEPIFNHEKVFKFNKITENLLEYFSDSFISFRVYAVQEESTGDLKKAHLATKELRDAKKGTLKNQSTDSKSEISQLKEEVQRLRSKELQLQKLCSDWSKKDGDKMFKEFLSSVTKLANK